MSNECGVYFLDENGFLDFIEALNDYYNGDNDEE